MTDTDRLINLIFRERDRRLWQAVMLAPSIQVCEALLKGQPVPRSALDPVWVGRFGL